MNVYDNFSAHGKLLCFSCLIMIDTQVVVIVSVIPMSCHIFMQLEKYWDVVDSFNNLKIINIIAKYSEFVVQ